MRHISCVGALALSLFALSLPTAAQQPAAPPSGPPKFDIHAPIDPSRGDALSNPAYHGPEVLKFMGVKPGQKIADIFPGRFTLAFAQTVGPKGKVYGFMPNEILKVHPGLGDLMPARKADPKWAGVTFLEQPMDAMTLPDGLDTVFIRQNYHDLHVRFMGPADVAAFNRKVFAALKPGGTFVIIDHVAPAGMDVAAASNRLHRIDPATVRAEVEAAGFKFDGESKVLADPTDDHTHMVLETAILGKTDQFLYRFRKPK
jgi:predicted methyltransferase